MKVFLIGAGRIAGHHLDEIIRSPYFNVCGLSDLDLKKAELLIKNRINIPIFHDFHQGLSETAPDIVVICTPSGLHYEHCSKVLDTIDCHLIIEKPLTLNPSDAEELYAKAAKVNKNIFPVYQNRLNKAVYRVKSAIDNGELGTIYSVSVRVLWCRPQRYYDLSPWRGTFYLDGGCLSNQGIHHLDIMTYFCGKAESIYSLNRTYAVSIPVEDSSYGIINFSSGSTGTYQVTTSVRPDDLEASVLVIGSKGYARVSGVAVNRLAEFTPKPEECDVYTEVFENVYGNGHSRIYENVADCLLNGGDYFISQEDAIHTIRLLSSAYRSSECNKAIYLNMPNATSTRLGAYDAKLAGLYSISSQ